MSNQQLGYALGNALFGRPQEPDMSVLFTAARTADAMAAARLATANALAAENRLAGRKNLADAVHAVYPDTAQANLAAAIFASNPTVDARDLGAFENPNARVGYAGAASALSKGDLLGYNQQTALAGGKPFAPVTITGGVAFPTGVPLGDAAFRMVPTLKDAPKDTAQGGGKFSFAPLPGNLAATAFPLGEAGGTDVMGQPLRAVTDPEKLKVFQLWRMQALEDTGDTRLQSPEWALSAFQAASAKNPALADQVLSRASAGAPPSLGDAVVNQSRAPGFGLTLGSGVAPILRNPLKATAPAAAVQYVLQHPELAAQFKAKYGYLPPGLDR